MFSYIYKALKQIFPGTKNTDEEVEGWVEVRQVKMRKILLNILY